MCLVAGPIGGWPAGNCCGDADCCKSGVCPMHRNAVKSQDQDEAMQCHHAHAAPQPASKCNASAQCSGHAEKWHAAPLPRGVLSAPAAIPAPMAKREAIATVPVRSRQGFIPVPFEPPRLAA